MTTAPTGPSDAAMARVRAGRNPDFVGFRTDDPPNLIHLPPDAGSCRAETFDGIDRKRCTRPASFLRDGLAVCRQHGHLEHIRASE